MQQLKAIRQYLATVLLDQTVGTPTAQGRAQLGQDTGLAPQVVDNALMHGITETAEYVLICQALDLDPADLLQEAIAHVYGGLMADTPNDPPQWIDLTEDEEDAAAPWITDPAAPIPTGPWLEIRCAHIGAQLYGTYHPDADRFQIGHDSIIERTYVTAWRVQPQQG